MLTPCNYLGISSAWHRSWHIVLKEKERGRKGRRERRGGGQGSKKEKGKEKEGERCVDGRRERKQREEKGRK